MRRTGQREDDDIYDAKGDQRLSPAEVRVLKQIAQTGIVARYLFAVILGVLSLVSAIWAIAEHLGRR